MSKTAKLYKAACSLNLAVLLRAVRFGPRDAGEGPCTPMISSIRWRGRRVGNHGTIPAGSQGLEPSGQLPQNWPLGGDRGHAVRHHRRLAHLRRWITRNS